MENNLPGKTLLVAGGALPLNQGLYSLAAQLGYNFYEIKKAEYNRSVKTILGIGKV